MPGCSSGNTPDNFKVARRTNSAEVVLKPFPREMPCTLGYSIVAFSIKAATGLRSLLITENPKRVASNGMAPPPAVGSRTWASKFAPNCFSSSLSCSVMEWRKALGYPYSTSPRGICPARSLLSFLRRAATGSPSIPIARRKRSWGVPAGSIDARTAARDAIKGRRAHQTWTELLGGKTFPAREKRRSRKLSSPSAAMGSQRSISRLSLARLLAPSTFPCVPSMRQAVPHRGPRPACAMPADCSMVQTKWRVGRRTW